LTSIAKTQHAEAAVAAAAGAGAAAASAVVAAAAAGLSGYCPPHHMVQLSQETLAHTALDDEKGGIRQAYRVKRHHMAWRAISARPMESNGTL